MVILPRAAARSCTASAALDNWLSATTFTPSVSNHFRAIPAATSGLFCIFAVRMTIFSPFTSLPKSSAASRAATAEPSPARSD